jgi:cytidylate kinase
MNQRQLPAPVAIDGPAASGKSTIAEALADEFGYAVFDTGKTYRAFTLEALALGIEAADEEACAQLAESIDLAVDDGIVYLHGEDVTADLREPDVERNVSAYSAIPAVRAAMVRLQRRVGCSRPSVVVGRDIGTVVFPEAPIKIFLTAEPHERARRRSTQAGGWGHNQAVEDARADIEHRDTIDSGRETSPTRAAADATIIDTTKLSLAEVIEHATELVRTWQP